jgi:hypothetical protein
MLNNSTTVTKLGRQRFACVLICKMICLENGILFGGFLGPLKYQNDFSYNLLGIMGGGITVRDDSCQSDTLLIVMHLDIVKSYKNQSEVRVKLQQ